MNLRSSFNYNLNNFFQLRINLKDLKIFSKKLAAHVMRDDIFLLQGELGPGKTLNFGELLRILRRLF